MIYSHDFGDRGCHCEILRAMRRMVSNSCVNHIGIIKASLLGNAYCGLSQKVFYIEREYIAWSGTRVYSRRYHERPVDTDWLNIRGETEHSDYGGK